MFFAVTNLFYCYILLIFPELHFKGNVLNVSSETLRNNIVEASINVRMYLQPVSESVVVRGSRVSVNKQD